jgi:hypothetical protein
MASLSAEHQSLLVANLNSDYVCLLPALLPNTKPQADRDKKIYPVPLVHLCCGISSASRKK